MTLNGEASPPPPRRPSWRLDQHARRAGLPGDRQHRPTGSRPGATASRRAQLHRPRRRTAPSRPRSSRRPSGTQTLTFAPEADARRGSTQPGANFGTETRLRTGRRRGRRRELPALPGGGDHRTGDEREAAPALDHQHGRRPGVCGHHERLVRERAITWSNRPAPTTAAVSRRGCDRQRRLGRVGRDSVAARRRAGQLPPSQTGQRRPLLPLARVEHGGDRGHSSWSRSRTTPIRGRRAHRPCACPRAGLRALHRAEPRARPAARAPSCNPPAPTSPTVTVGTPDANGAARVSSGFDVVPASGDPATPEDEADVALMQVTRRARAGSLLDYAGELQLRPPGLTDRGSGASGVEPATLAGPRPAGHDAVRAHRSGSRGTSARCPPRSTRSCRAWCARAPAPSGSWAGAGPRRRLGRRRRHAGQLPIHAPGHIHSMRPA